MADVDWSKSMSQTFEFYRVDPSTWKDDERLEYVTSASLSFDAESETLCSSSYETTELIRDEYIRTYLIVTQNGVQHRFPLGTFLVQSPNDNYDGKVHKYSLEGVSPIQDLTEDMPEIGYWLGKDVDEKNGKNVSYWAYKLVREHSIAPAIHAKRDEVYEEKFVSNTNDTWLSFIADFLATKQLHMELDELGRVIFAPDQETDALAPVWTYTDDNSSILYPEISVDRDISSIPNVVEVIYSSPTKYFRHVVENNNPNSDTSIQNRGRRILYRETEPKLSLNPSNDEISAYASRLLTQLSSVEFRITYRHGYCPVRVNDCVLIDYERAGLTDIKAKVVSQTITCSTGCAVEETAVFTKDLWRRNRR